MIRKCTESDVPAVGALYVGFLSLLTFLINNVITDTNKPWIAALTATAVNFC